MKEDILNDLVIGDKQAETFAYNIYRDISLYLKNNVSDFLCWIVGEITLEYEKSKMVFTCDKGTIEVPKNHYNLYSYKNKIVD